MIKKICYLTLSLVFILISLNLIISHALATDGEELTHINVLSQALKEETDNLHRQIMEAQSLKNILTRAESAGFINLDKL